MSSPPSADAGAPPANPLPQAAPAATAEVPSPVVPAAASKAAAPKKKAPAAKAATGTQAKAKKPAAPRPRKKATSKASAASANNLQSEAKNAQADLAQQRAQQAAKKLDPLWYRIEDVFPAIKSIDSTPKAFPEQIDVLVEKSLAVCGLGRSDVTPQAMACLLEHARRYASELMYDAQDYAHAANRLEITRQDLTIAVEFRGESYSISSQVPKLNLVSQQLNRVPLPPIPPQCYNGVLLPPKEYQLTARTFDIITGAHVNLRMTQVLPVNPKPKTTNQPSYGATKGQQIPVVLKTQSATTTGGPIPMDISEPTPVAAPAESAGASQEGPDQKSTSSSPNLGANNTSSSPPKEGPIATPTDPHS